MLTKLKVATNVHKLILPLKVESTRSSTITFLSQHHPSLLARQPFKGSHRTPADEGGEGRVDPAMGKSGQTEPCWAVRTVGHYGVC